MAKFSDHDTYIAVYRGEHVFNRKTWKTRAPKPTAEHISIAVEPIIEAHIFDEVQAVLKSRNPRTTAPRTITGPILLTGLATCATCGGGMTLRTGKYGRYRYYTCATSAQKGKCRCAGRSIPMDKLDTIVMDRVLGDLLTPRRVSGLLASLMGRQAQRAGARASRLAALRSKLTDAETRLKRLYSAIEAGLSDLGDATLKDRIAEIRAERDRAQAALTQATAEASAPAQISPDKIAAFTDLMQTNLRTGDTPFRRAYLRALLDNVEVGDTEIRIHGRRTILEKLVAAGDGATPSSVPSFVPKWRPRQDSNLRPTD